MTAPSLRNTASIGWNWLRMMRGLFQYLRRGQADQTARHAILGAATKSVRDVKRQINGTVQ